MEGVIFANPKLHGARPVEGVILLQVLYDVQQQVGSLDLDTYCVVSPEEHKETEGKTGRPGHVSTYDMM